MMNYYEQKQLQDRESRMIGAGVTFILLSPAFGIIAGAFLASAAALYVGTTASIAVGIMCFVAAWKERKERISHQ